MIPTEHRFLSTQFQIVKHPDKTYRMWIEDGRIRGYGDGRDAMVQAIYKALNTERSTYSAYSANYGVEFIDLYGMPMSYVLPELKRRVTEALTWDDRIERVDAFDFTVEKGKVHCTFTVHTVSGEIVFGKVVGV